LTPDPLVVLQLKEQFELKGRFAPQAVIAVPKLR